MSQKLLLNEYVTKVLNGEIVASKKVKLACERHLKDLKRVGSDDFPWVFDEDKAFRPVKFIETFCSPSKGDFSKLEMQPWQHFIVGSVYGWIHKETGLRRFKEAVIMVGRKNGS